MPHPLTYDDLHLLNAHFKKTGNMLNELMNTGSRSPMKLDIKTPPGIITAELVGGECEMIQRNVGSNGIWTAPLKHIGNELWAWFGYREEWSSENSKGNKRKYTFRSTSPTIYFGFKNIKYKPQMFRQEWAGWAK